MMFFIAYSNTIKMVAGKLRNHVEGSCIGPYDPRMVLSERIDLKLIYKVVSG